MQREAGQVDAVDDERAVAVAIGAARGLDQPPERRDKVDLPEPVRPTTPTLALGAMVQVTLRSANGSSGR